MTEDEHLKGASVSEEDQLASKNQFRFSMNAELIASLIRLERIRKRHNDRDWLNKKLDNIRESQRWLATQRNEETAHLCIAFTEELSVYLLERGHTAELRHWCEDSINACEYLHRNASYFYYLLSEAYHALGDWTQATHNAQRALQLSEGLDERTYARSVLMLGLVQYSQGLYKIALQTLAHAETLLSQQMDYEGKIRAKLDIANYYGSRGNFNSAIASYEEIVGLQEQVGEIGLLGYTLLMIGVYYRKKGDYEQAISYLQQALHNGEARQHRRDTATASHHLAWVYLRQRNMDQARKFCDQALTGYEESGDKRGIADAYEQLGCITQTCGQFEEAAVLFEKSLNMRYEIGNQHGAASSLRRLGILHMKQKHRFKAAFYMYKSLNTYNRLGMLTHNRIGILLKEVFPNVSFLIKNNYKEE